MDKSEAPIISRAAVRLSMREHVVQNTIALLDEGNTVPFIARYRKEQTGNLDELGIIAIRDLVTTLRELEKRRSHILSAIEKQGRLNDKLRREILAAPDSESLEDLYLPYKVRKQTRAEKARQAGLEPLAMSIMEGSFAAGAAAGHIPAGVLDAFISSDAGIEDGEAALRGARDIIAEQISTDAGLRHQLRILFRESSVFSSEVLAKHRESEDAQVYKDYFSHSETLSRLKGHRLLAMMRGQREGFLRIRLEPEAGDALKLCMRGAAGRAPGGMKAPVCAAQISEAAEDAYQRLIKPSLENETLGSLRREAEAEAIKVFSGNLRELLLSPPMGTRITLGVDPGLRTGCKLVVIDESGGLLAHDVMYPLAPRRDEAGAARLVRTLIERYGVQAIAVGNGTGGRDAERFIRSLNPGNGISVVSVNESGASVYSASPLAREEFPDEDVTVRGAVSIARRLIDPLAELVKIDPQSIGVGQYQHDVDQKALKHSLDDVVSSCVNTVGVDLNTASRTLLSYVSGLSSQHGRNIVEHRRRAGGFRSRAELLEVAGVGEKTYQQAAGFLRIPASDNPLDASAVHPERYALVDAMAAKAGCSVTQLMEDQERRKSISLKDFLGGDIGMETLKDIMDELAKPGRDPRQAFEEFNFAEGVEELEDVREGMRLPGIVTNITKFGAFVDIGVHQDGLIHISQMADRFIQDPREVLSLGQKLTVRVLEVDIRRRRISLSIRDGEKKSSQAG